MVQGLASGSVGSWHEVPRTSLAPSSARLRSLCSRRPWVQGLRFGRRRADILQMSCGLRFTSVVAEQTSPGRLATHLPQGYGRCVAGAHGSKVSASVGAEQTSSRCLAVSALLLSLQNRRPPDVLQPIFHKALVVAGQALYNDKTGKVGFL